MIAGITNHLKAERARMDEIDEHQPAAPLLNLEGELTITVANLIQSRSSLLIVFDYNFLVPLKGKVTCFVRRWVSTSAVSPTSWPYEAV